MRLNLWPSKIVDEKPLLNHKEDVIANAIGSMYCAMHCLLLLMSFTICPKWLDIVVVACGIYDLKLIINPIVNM